MGSGGKRARAGRPPPKPEVVKLALELAAKSTPQEAAVEMGKRGFMVSQRSIYLWQTQAAQRASAAPAIAPEPLPAPTSIAETPATAKDRQIDELLTTSREFQKIKEAMTAFGAKNPTAALQLATELRKVHL